MQITGSIEMTVNHKGGRGCQNLIQAIKRTRLNLDNVIEVDLTEPARTTRPYKVIIGTRETKWRPAS